MTTSEGKQRRGFASMTSEKQREIASKGGRAAHVKGTAHEWTPDEARFAGRKGAKANRDGHGRRVKRKTTQENGPALSAKETLPEATAAMSGGVAPGSESDKEVSGSLSMTQRE
jgi:uncharacterized protein